MLLAGRLGLKGRINGGRPLAHARLHRRQACLSFCIQRMSAANHTVPDRECPFVGSTRRNRISSDSLKFAVHLENFGKRWRVRSARTLPNPHGPIREIPPARNLALVLENRRETRQSPGDVDVLGTKRLLADRQGSLEQNLCLGVAPCLSKLIG